jgi:hypothetical protein
MRHIKNRMEKQHLIITIIHIIKMQKIENENLL